MTGNLKTINNFTGWYWGCFMCVCGKIVIVWFILIYHLVAFKHKRAIPKISCFGKIDFNDFDHLKSSHALLFLNLFLWNSENSWPAKYFIVFSHFLSKLLKNLFRKTFKFNVALKTDNICLVVHTHNGFGVDLTFCICVKEGTFRLG